MAEAGILSNCALGSLVEHSAGEYTQTINDLFDRESSNSEQCSEAFCHAGHCHYISILNSQTLSYKRLQVNTFDTTYLIGEPSSFINLLRRPPKFILGSTVS